MFWASAAASSNAEMYAKCVAPRPHGMDGSDATTARTRCSNDDKCWGYECYNFGSVTAQACCVLWKSKRVMDVARAVGEQRSTLHMRKNEWTRRNDWAVTEHRRRLESCPALSSIAGSDECAFEGADMLALAQRACEHEPLCVAVVCTEPTAEDDTVGEASQCKLRYGPDMAGEARASGSGVVSYMKPSAAAERRGCLRGSSSMRAHYPVAASSFEAKSGILLVRYRIADESRSAFAATFVSSARAFMACAATDGGGEYKLDVRSEFWSSPEIDFIIEPFHAVSLHSDWADWRWRVAAQEPPREWDARTQVVLSVDAACAPYSQDNGPSVDVTNTTTGSWTQADSYKLSAWWLGVRGLLFPSIPNVFAQLGLSTDTVSRLAWVDALAAVLLNTRRPSPCTVFGFSEGDTSATRTF